MIFIVSHLSLNWAKFRLDVKKKLLFPGFNTNDHSKWYVTCVPICLFTLVTWF